MADTKPGDGGAERLKAYWTEGPGAAKIRWGTPGDFNRCVRAITTAVAKDGRTIAPQVVRGLCSNLHLRATGARPGKAPGEQVGKG